MDDQTLPSNSAPEVTDAPVVAAPIPAPVVEIADAPSSVPVPAPIRAEATIPEPEPEPAQTPIEPEPVQPADSGPADMPPTAPGSPTGAPAAIPVQDQIQGLDQAPALPDQSGFIHGLLVRAQAKIQSNRQKKLDKLMAFAEKNRQVSNEEAVVLLRVSAATATRYLSRLVKEGRLVGEGRTRDLRYRFVR